MAGLAIDLALGAGVLLPLCGVVFLLIVIPSVRDNRGHEQR